MVAKGTSTWVCSGLSVICSAFQIHSHVGLGCCGSSYKNELWGYGESFSTEECGNWSQDRRGSETGVFHPSRVVPGVTEQTSAEFNREASHWILRFTSPDPRAPDTRHFTFPAQ